MSAVTLLVAFGVAAVLNKGFDPDQYATDAARELGQLQMIIAVSGVFAYLGVLLSCRALANSGCISVFQLEAVIVASCMLMAMLLVFVTKHYIARAFGHEDTEAVWGIDLGGTDGNVLIFLDACVTALHLLVPIRWVVLVPMEVLTIFVYAVPAYALGSPTMDTVPFNVTGLLVLIVLAALGKRASERQERMLFAGLLSEKRMRFEAEFQLSTRQGPDRSPAQDARSTGSAPETSATGQAFYIEDGAQLGGIRAIGEREQWLIRNSEVELLPNRVLGMGGFGIVMSGLYHNTLVAVKAPRDDIQRGGGGVSRCLAELCNELRILRRLRHPNIVFLYGACLDTNFEKLCLVLEFVQGTPLGPFVRSLPLHCPGCSGDDGGSTASDGGAAVRIRIVLDILNALRYLHSRCPVVVHGDLKDANIFVEERRDPQSQLSCRAKLLDFGLARIVTRSARPLGGTVRWMAPELFARQRVPPNAAADVYSFGQLLYFVTVGLPPFHEKRADQVLKRLRAGQPRALTWPARCSDLAQSCRAVVQECVQSRPGLRPTVQQVSDELSVLLGEGHLGDAAAGGAGEGGEEQARSQPDIEHGAATMGAAEPQREQPDGARDAPREELGPPAAGTGEQEVLVATQDAAAGGPPTAAVGPALPATQASAPLEFQGLVQLRTSPTNRVTLSSARGSLSPVYEHAQMKSTRPDPTQSSSKKESGSGDDGRLKMWARGPTSGEAVANVGFELTPTETQRDSLVFLLLQWNHARIPNACCWLHASLRALDKVSKELDCKPCRTGDNAGIFSGQCGSCKLMFINGQTRCDFCETSASASRDHESIPSIDSGTSESI